MKTLKEIFEEVKKIFMNFKTFWGTFGGILNNCISTWMEKQMKRNDVFSH